MQKIRIWNSKTLADMYVIMQQMQAGIAAIAQKINVTSISDIPNSMVPTQTLYELSLCYELMYEKLLEYDLLNTGNKKQSSTMH